jgi:S1-C subfamily serine protease
MADVSRRYVGALAVVAILVLTGGLLLRSRLYPTPVETAPPSEASTLRQLSQEAQLRRSATFVAEQATAFATYVEYVAATGASGVWWSGDTLLSSTRARTVVSIVRAPGGTASGLRGDSARRAPAIVSDSAGRGWVVVIGKDADGQVLSAQFLAGGRTATECSGATVQRYVLGPSLDGRLAGAGVFGIDGAVRGLAVWCNGQVIALPVPEVRRLLARADSIFESPLGFRIATASSIVRSFVGSDSAVLVTFVRSGTAADAMGLRAGDVVVSIDGGAATAEVARAMMGLAAPADSLVVMRPGARGADLVSLRRATNEPRDEPLGIGFATSPPEQGIPIARVRAGSLAARAGLRAGDRLVRVGSTAVTSAAAADRLLATVGDDEGPTLVVVAREDGEHALVVGPRAPVSAADSAQARR